jgi:hypothetical protein
MQLDVVEVIFEGMCNQHVDYTIRKILKEIQLIEAGFICEFWGEPTSKGTRAYFRSAEEDELLVKVQELKKFLKIFKGECEHE